MTKFIHKKRNFFDYLCWRNKNREKNRFFNRYSDLAHQHIQNYPSKYLACFAFDGDTARILTHGAPEKEELDCVFDYLSKNNLIRGGGGA